MNKNIALLINLTQTWASRGTYALASLILLLVITTSCDRRPLELEDPATGDYAKILLLTDWKNLGEVPTGMTAIFFPEDGSQPTTIMTNNIGRNIVRLKRGTYKILIFNQSIYEFGSMSFADMGKFETALARLNQLNGNSTSTAADYTWFRSVCHNQDSIDMAVRSPELFNADRITYEVTPEICARQKYIEENPSGWGDIVEEFADTIFSIPPPVPPTMYIKVRVKGLNNAYQVKGYITNMAKADYFGPWYNNEEKAIHVLGNWTLAADAGDKTRGYSTTSFRCFGVPGLRVSTADNMHTSRYWEEEYKASRMSARALTASEYTRALDVIDYGRNMLYLEYLLKDGQTHKHFAFDVTDFITYTEGQLRLDLVLDLDPNAPGGSDTPPVILPDVPDVIGSGGAGFDATVEDWKHEDHNISF